MAAVVAPSFEDLLALGQAEAQSRRPDLQFLEGDVTVAQLHAAAAMNDALIRYAAQLARDTFIDGAEGDALTTLVDDHFNLQRVEATAAQVTLTFTRTSGGAGGTIEQDSQIATEVGADGNQVIFATNADVVFAGADNGPHSVLATAIETGATGNVAAGTVIQQITTPFDTTVTVTNAAGAAGGNAEESDADLRQRARTFYQTLRRGTLAALEFGAKGTLRQDGSSAGVRIARATEDPTTFAVTLSVSDSDGSSTLQMVSDVVAEIENWRCAGVPVTVVGGQASTVDLAISIEEVVDGFDVAANAQNFIDAATLRINKLRVGETLYADALVAAIIGVAPDDVLSVSFVATVNAILYDPANSDVVPATGKVLRAGTITVS
jgi:hypothetical protein